LFLWVRLPEGLDASNLLVRALEKNVAYVPGSVFFPDGSGHNSFRLNFSNSQPEQIKLGIQRLGEVLTLAVEESSNT
jgi:2-aminoadipate transaminase